MSRPVNGFTINEYRDAKPWGQLEETNWDLVLSMMPTYGTALVDTVTVPNPHKHARIFDENETQRAEMTSTLFMITKPTLVQESAAGGGIAALAGSLVTVERAGNVYYSLLCPAANEEGILFGRAGSNAAGRFLYNHNTARFVTVVEDSTIQQFWGGYRLRSDIGANNAKLFAAGTQILVDMNTYNCGVLYVRERADDGLGVIQDSFSIYAWVFNVTQDLDTIIQVGNTNGAVTIVGNNLVFTTTVPAGGNDCITWWVEPNNWAYAW